MSEEAKPPPSNPSNMEGLLKLYLEASGMESSSNSQSSMDPERQQWLQEAIDSIIPDAEKIMTCLRVLHSGCAAIAQRLQNDETYSNMEKSLDNLMVLTASLDNANDFQKMDGFQVLQPLLAVPQENVQAKTAELIAILVQNNPFCQNAALQNGLLSTLLQILDNNNSEAVCIKALYAVSCLCPQNSEAQRHLEHEDGFSVLMRAMQRPVEKLRIKVAFLLTSLCNEDVTYMGTLYKMGFVEKIAALIQGNHDASHEHLLSALLALVSQHEAARNECSREELQLKKTLEERTRLLEGKEEHREEKEYCLQLLDLCFNKTQDSQEVDR